MHDSRAEASIQGVTVGSAADLMKRVKTFENENANAKVYITGSYEIKCSLKKEYISHWLLRDLPLEFVVENKNSWNVHPINIPSAGIGKVQNNY